MRQPHDIEQAEVAFSLLHLADSAAQVGGPGVEGWGQAQRTPIAIAGHSHTFQIF
jgi:hypothetical protein